MVSECLVYHTLDPNVLDPSHLSLRSKRFRLVSEQRKTEERDSQFMKQEPKNKNAIFRELELVDQTHLFFQFRFQMDTRHQSKAANHLFLSMADEQLLYCLGLLLL